MDYMLQREQANGINPVFEQHDRQGCGALSQVITQLVGALAESQLTLHKLAELSHTMRLRPDRLTIRLQLS